MDGIPFVTQGRWAHVVSGLKIDVQDVWGREALVAYHDGFGGSC